MEEAIDRLVPVLAAAKRHGVTLNFDTEHDESKDAIFTLVRTIGERWPDGPDLGCVVQAYRRDAETDLTTMIEWSRRRVADGAAPLQIRLVKGAYWDAETIAARANGWPSPVWTDKAETDRNYEHLTGLLMAAAGAVRPAIASHNVRSIAYAATLARAMRAAGGRLGGSGVARHGRAAARGGAGERPAGAGVPPGRRARSGDGVPRPAAAREHGQRIVRAQRLPQPGHLRP